MGMLHRHKVSVRNASVKPKVEEVVKEAGAVSPASNTYTKTDINRLSKDELVALATDNGVERAADMSGADLKAKLIEMLVK